MMKNHEALVHFPIALFMGAFFFSLIGLFYRRGLFKEVIFWNLILGIFATAAAIYTGLIEEEQITSKNLQDDLELHQRNAYFVGVFVICLTSWMGWRKRRMGNLEYVSWICLFFIASSSVVYQSYMGHNMSNKLQMEASKPVPVRKEMNYGWNF